jgi:CxxC motif-containing protein (DUF1111 family)
MHRPFASSADPVRRWQISSLALPLLVVAALGLLLVGSLQAADSTTPPGELTGGATTVWVDGKNAFSLPAANLSDEERTRFAIGNSFFKRNWVEAPASTKVRDGLGPHFITRSCGGCHALDGRGRAPEVKGGRHEQPVGLLIRLSVPGVADPHEGVLPEPTYGGQFNNAAVQGVRPEGEVTLRTTPVRGRFADGTRYTLHKPIYGFRKLAYGAMSPKVLISPRVAPQLMGIGLLEAIAEADILQNAADQAAIPGPIKGQVNRVWDAVAQKEMIGRFGWKANVASIAHQSAGAFRGDIGITSVWAPGEGCTPVQKDCLQVGSGGHGGAFEIDQATLEDVVFYQAVLAPVARRQINDPQVRQGQALFEQSGCTSCHRPSYTTSQGPNPRMSSPTLNGQTIWPYTDLLLHDMGPGLADGRPDFAASGSQWKTPALWGIGLIQAVNGHTQLLHDGRANGVLEAVLWHGGEAQAAQQQVLQMSRAQRAALVKFVESL